MKLSVSLVTYQHAETAGQAIDSALRQKTDFPVEIIVGDDASTDATQDVLKAYQAKYPDRISLILRKTNAGDFGLTNVIATMEAAKGEYIAFLDGDDYWTAPDKLQKQVEFLDAHPDCAICAHRVEHLRTDGVRILSPNAPNGTGTYATGALITRNFAPKISTVVRTSALAELPDWYRTSTVASADWLFNVLVSRNGQVGFLDDVMAVHRIHQASVSAGYGPERMFADKLKVLARLREYVPQAADDLKRLERKLRWKQWAARLSPRGFALLRRLSGFARSRPGGST